MTPPAESWIIHHHTASSSRRTAHDPELGELTMTVRRAVEAETALLRAHPRRIAATAYALVDADHARFQFIGNRFRLRPPENQAPSP